MVASVAFRLLTEKTARKSTDQNGQITNSLHRHRVGHLEGVNWGDLHNCSQNGPLRFDKIGNRLLGFHSNFARNY